MTLVATIAAVIVCLASLAAAMPHGGELDLVIFSKCWELIAKLGFYYIICNTYVWNVYFKILMN